MLSKDFFDLYNTIASKFSEILEDESLFFGQVNAEDGALISFLQTLDRDGIDTPKIVAMYDTSSQRSLDMADLDDAEMYEGTGPWMITLSKDDIAKKLSDVADDTCLFFNSECFLSFLECLEPFHKDNHTYDRRTRLFLVNGLDQPIGGENFYAIGTNSSFPDVETKLPSSDDVHNLVHVNTTESVRVCPRSISLSSAGSKLDNLPNLKRSIAKLLAVCLVQELKTVDGIEKVTVKGSKKQIAVLSNGTEKISNGLLDELNKAVIWVYEERSETRLQLIMDRLSLDMNDSDSYLESLGKYLERALEQAKDSYAFVILDRKDDYHKEVRDLIKDMRTQADLYATKTRSLVSSLARDTLGILVFLSFSFMARAQRIDIETLLTNNAMTLILSVMSVYLFVSITLQILVHMRDDCLTQQENTHWLKVLQNYTRTDDQQQNFLKPIEKRRKTFHFATLVIALLYLGLILIVCNLQSILTTVLSPSL
ncbi:hypothetical protein FJM67_16980 [Maribrevibacterium harenarium]|uniref:Uncharacterized protein n=1 Tax=Maribrevibacterium harenarium TaxID=2589817 RepID=A0A501WF63_9GAMM|nr:hypothetical protein [Maribrevibacterium harenarium]TPE44166.1 hypothetical protein FJM67_16980 [Maribrevibacterium harenarium]